ncbi:MAG: hypothetical protein ACPG32_04415 [Akkermansiaceae bacterium]
MATISAGTKSRRGSDFPIHQPVDKFGGGIGQETGTRTIRVDYDGTSTSWATHLPDVGDAHPVASWLIFKDYSLTQLPLMGDLADLVLNYVQEEFGSPPAEIPPDEISENGAVLEVDIVRHPKFGTTNPGWSGNSMRDFYNPKDRRIFVSEEVPEEFVDEDGKTKEHPKAGETVPEEIRGMSKYVVGTGTVTAVEYSASEPASVIEDVGKREVPAGQPGTEDNWLIMGARKARRGAWWVLEYVYQFSEKTISGFVYEDK